MTNNAICTVDEYIVELVVRPSRRRSHPLSREQLSLLMRESNQGVVNAEELERLLVGLGTIKGCDETGHSCVKVRPEFDHDDAPYVAVVFDPECFRATDAQTQVRFEATTLLNTARSNSYKAARKATEKMKLHG
ncbi:MAG: hypothetical protein JWO07_660 [Candidatus Saccharibacteria bacterium]|nr:hypothetical protein [Candidatus Saccharibacteria bacterium]